MSSFRVLVLGLVLILVLGSAFLGRTAIAGFFSNLHLIFAGAGDPGFSYANFKNLETENAGLKMELANYERLKNATGTIVLGGRYAIVSAEVYSDYPWNDYSAIAIGAGSRDGLKPGMPVVAAGGALIGKIKTVAGTQSEVETIFDPAWRSAVAIGAGRVKALLSGGTAPSLSLVPKNSGVLAGDAVTSIASDLPMDLPVGQVASISETPSGLWASAQAALPWDPGNLNMVYVITNFP